MDPLPVPEPPPPPPFNPIPPKKPFPVVWIPALVFFLAFAGLLVYQQVQIQTLLKATSLIPTNNTPTPATDPTADWKTYTNDELHLSFKLPPTLTTPGIFQRTQTPTEKGTQRCWALDQTQGLRIVTQVNAGGESCYLNKFTLGLTSFDHEAGRMGGFADYKSFEPYTNIPPSLITRLTNPKNIEMIIIRGADGPKTDPEAQSGFPINGTPGEGNIGALIKNSDATYPVITVQMVLTNDLTQETFNQILSTFKFVK